MSTKDLSSIDYSKSALLSPLESQILTQYQFLNSQLLTLNREISKLTSKSIPLSAEEEDDETEDWKSAQTAGIGHLLLDNLRNLEMKIGLIHTLFKGAVYTLFMEQDNAELAEEDGEGVEREDQPEEEDEDEDVDPNVTKGEIVVD
ncbi:DASH complex subunit Dad3-domain-containing protein [Scheffersomyces xylosifermentans]|uniref:DASH complex subunit Dad3-domain-containing protein n=1 Tax=Scheffersomyces xylosifermentans TaxID=1304137 RepID=UPI00315D3A70